MALKCVQLAQAFERTTFSLKDYIPLEYLPQDWSAVSSDFGSAAKCAACTGIVLKLSNEILKPSLDDYLVSFATEVCMHVATDAATICPGIIPMMATPVLDMIGRELLSKERVCN
jgi:hypothetical protein